jgi:hypothetical protein
MIFKKTKIALSVASAALVMAGALVAPQAVANSKAEKVAAAMDRKVEAMELQIQQMGNMMEAMQAEMTHVKTQSTNNNNDGRFMELENWMASVKNTPTEVRTKDHMVFFRGGYAKMDHSRTDLLTGGAVNADATVAGLGGNTNLTNTGPTSDNGWYVGAGFDFSLSDNLWGFMDGTEVLAELQFEYKKFGTQVSTGQHKAGLTAQNPLCTTVNGAIGGAVGTPAVSLADGSGAHCSQVTVSQFTLSAAPKIKFMKGSKFRPWIIPAGLAIHVISPPSDGVTVFNTGVMFAGGADYNIWEDFYIGADVRYHLTGDDADGVDTDGFTAGGYVGIGF